MGEIFQAKATELRALRDSKGQLAAILGVISAAGAVTAFVIILTIYGEVVSNLNLLVFDTGTRNLIALLPLVMVGSVLIAMVFGALIAVIVRA